MWNSSTILFFPMPMMLHMRKDVLRERLLLPSECGGVCLYGFLLVVRNSRVPQRRVYSLRLEEAGELAEA